MAKIPFDIKFRPQIESGKYKVVTAKEQPVRIICWDRSTTYWKIVALILAPDGKTENPFTYDVNGKESDGCLHNHELDLFILTPEPEWSEEDEKFFKTALWHISYSVSNGKTTDDHNRTTDWLKGVKERLKSLRPYWKPSEEQMNYLCAVVNEAKRKDDISVSGYPPARILESLYNDLKKLKGI